MSKLRQEETKVLKHFNLPSNPLTRGSRERRLIGKGGCGPV
ncbi:hypothetical protein T09_4480 [Trichinella sp. T9]|nr:hypothetical protein T09_4480 [Trichinella sp. T9]